MNTRKFNIVYESSVGRLVEANSSFDRGVLRVAYTGKNRNKSFISKDTFEKCIQSIYNCPVVCNYNRETDSIGAHDVEIVSSGKGMKIVNITQPVGVVPESANYWWETIEEDNGEVHEYLCVDIIIWKRQEAYTKIKDNGITDESMEITVKSGKTIDGYYHIDSFEFTAFCLLESAEPCYESACVEMFSLSEFQSQYTKMMSEFKEHFQTVTTSKEDDINPQNITQNLSKGGNISLSKVELLTKYGLSIDDLDFDINDFSVEELEKKFMDMQTNDKSFAEDDSETETSEDAVGVDSETDSENDDTQTDDTSEGEADDGDDDTATKKSEYSLSGEQFRDQLVESLCVEKYTDPYWGDMCRYMYVDYDAELSEVFCYDCEDWKLYGFAYSMNGDNVVINFESKKRKKFSIVDFDEGSTDFDYKYAFDAYGKAIVASKDAELSRIKDESEQKYNATIENMKNELEDLRNYQKTKMDAERKDAVDELFARFADLSGIEAFEKLREDCSDMTIEAVESKCFEIKGRNASALNFSANKPKSTRIIVEKKTVEEEPYGGLFTKYLPKTN